MIMKTCSGPSVLLCIQVELKRGATVLVMMDHGTKWTCVLHTLTLLPNASYRLNTSSLQCVLLNGSKRRFQVSIGCYVRSLSEREAQLSRPTLANAIYGPLGRSLRVH